MCINSTALHEKHISTESMINLLTTCYTPPENGFIYHIVSKTKPHLSFIRATTKRIEMHVREDNSNRGIIKSGGDNLEVCGFIHGFVSNSERKDLEKMFVSQTQLDQRYQVLHSPWSIQQKMSDFVHSHNSENMCNLHYSKTAILNQELM